MASDTENRGKATKEEVLGPTGTAAQPQIPEKWAKYYRRLMRTRDYLRKTRADLQKDAQEEQPQFSLHMADAGTDEYDAEFALTMISAEQDALFQIEEALRRIVDGTYGRCELTGKEISAERLDAIPWTRFTKDAEEELERTGQVEKTKLQPPGRIARVPTSRSVGGNKV